MSCKVLFYIGLLIVLAMGVMNCRETKSKGMAAPARSPSKRITLTIPVDRLQVWSTPGDGTVIDSSKQTITAYVGAEQLNMVKSDLANDFKCSLQGNWSIRMNIAELRVEPQSNYVIITANSRFEELGTVNSERGWELGITQSSSRITVKTDGECSSPQSDGFQCDTCTLFLVRE